MKPERKTVNTFRMVSVPLIGSLQGSLKFMVDITRAARTIRVHRGAENGPNHPTSS
jgi:hypothetical protein